MSVERRNFLKLLTFVPPAATIATAAVRNEGGEVGIVSEGRKPQEMPETPPVYQGSHMQQRDHALYDVLRVPAGVKVPKYWPFFTNPIGWNRPGSFDFKTYADTNMDTGSHLPPPRAQLVQRILFLWPPTNSDRDRDALAGGYYFEFQLGPKVYARAPLVKCPVLGHPKDLFSDFGTKRTPRRNSIALPVSLNLAKPVFIESLMYFAMNLHGEPFVPEADLELWAFLDGIGHFEVM